MSGSNLYQIQCLLFIVNTKRPSHSKQLRSSPYPGLAKGYALFPDNIKDTLSEVKEILAKDDVEVIERNRIYPALEWVLINGEVEVLQLLFAGEDEVTVSHSGTSTNLVVYNHKARIRSILPSSVKVKSCLSMRIVYEVVLDNENLKVLNRLLSLRPDISYQSGTILHFAVEYNCLKLVKIVLKHGANIDAQQADGSTSLCLAAERGFQKIFFLLLRSNANIHVKKKDDSTCLTVAAKNGNLLFVRSLLQRGAFVNAAMRHYYSEFDRGGRTPLHFAIENKDLNMVRLLLSHGADVNAWEYDDGCVLEEAVNSDNPKIVQSILSYKPDLENRENVYAFHLALQQGSKECKEMGDMMFEYGFLVRSYMVEDLDFLHGLVRQDRFDVIQECFHFGLDLKCVYTDASDCYPKGSTLLHTAAAYASEAMIHVLVNHGADINAACRRRKTPIYYATEKVNLEAVRTLLHLGARTDVSVGEFGVFLIHFASAAGIKEVVELLLNNGVDIHMLAEEDKMTALHFAAEKGHQNVVDLLIRHGAQIDYRDDGKKTALHTACDRKDNFGVIEILLLNGADVNAECGSYYDDERSVLSRAVSGSFELEVINMLLDFGARLDYTGNRKTSVLSKAALHYAENFQYLLEYAFTDSSLIRTTRICEWFVNVWDGITYKYAEKKALILARHLIKMKAAFIPISESQKVPWCCKDMTPDEFKTQCKVEVASLQNEKIGDTLVTFYDVLTKGTHRNICYARNDSILKTLNSNDYKTKFPIYASIIEVQFALGYRRKLLLNHGLKVFSVLIRGFSALPDELKEKIVGLLTNGDLRILKKACPRPNIQV